MGKITDDPKTQKGIFIHKSQKVGGAAGAP